MNDYWDENKYYCKACQDLHGIAYYCEKLHGPINQPSGGPCVKPVNVMRPTSTNEMTNFGEIGELI